MDAKLAILTAEKYFNDVFSGENIVNVGLEEVRFDDAHEEWLITLGFSWMWETGSGIPALAKQSVNIPRSYKIVKLKNEDGKLISITNRSVAIE